MKKLVQILQVITKSIYDFWLWITFRYNKTKVLCEEQVIKNTIVKLEQNEVLLHFAEINLSLKYVSDVETHEIIWSNQSVVKLMGRDVIGEKCFGVFKDFPFPCDFCGGDDENFDELDVIQRIKGDSKTGNLYLIRDSYRIINGRKLKYINAIELTNNLKEISEWTLKQKN